MASSHGSAETRQSLTGTHAACDVWALGCLLYELLTGHVLFPSDLDWAKFFITVTDPQQVCPALSQPRQASTVTCPLNMFCLTVLLH